MYGGAGKHTCGERKRWMIINAVESSKISGTVVNKHSITIIHVYTNIWTPGAFRIGFLFYFII